MFHYNYLEDLWCDVIGRTDGVVALRHSVRAQLQARPEVCKTNMTVFVGQNIVRFHVPERVIRGEFSG